jgi:8-oxo-dGTP pyrophosphatase MutT (NUDIX family)
MDELHKKVQVIVLHRNNNDYELLLLQTKADRGEYWQNVTGSIEGNESWEQGALRELLEETGLSGEIQQLELTYHFHDRWDRNVEEKVFVAQVSEKSVIICEQEHQGYRWVKTNEVKPEHFGHPNNYEAFLKALKCLK